VPHVFGSEDLSSSRLNTNGTLPRSTALDSGVRVVHL
jgi:hypothetical protein